MKLQTLFWIAVSLCVSGPSLAAEECKDTSARGMVRCNQAEVEKQDKEIALALARTTKLLENEPLTAGTVAIDQLKQSQNSWEKYRAGFCQSVGIATSGPNEWSYIHASTCSIELGKLRLKELLTLQELVQP